MYIVLGLGNPGREYQNTRHNVGFMTLDLLADRYDINICRQNFRSVFGEGRIGGQRVVLAKPDTYMNNSGWAARDLINWYKCENSELIVIYDDIDIPIGTLRIREGGSSGTHNGMRSIIYQLGFDDFPRVRVGIGQPDGERNLVSHVLGAPQGEEKDLLLSAMKNAADAVELIVGGNVKEAQARFNKKPKKEKKKKEENAQEVQAEVKEEQHE
ncbi:MAG: aminoacyl-tRNA hydrolase [Clostridia bacterium]|nr:aminoacyl-tRNA hydrolase [Clostridia bacterium]MBQ6692885.1 aminoacyl-tRNA hydrolase [Clostridia bacterium]MBQ7114326.1 aminoacyl-tRNA hydrolase [Clostridia bacterium]